MQVSLSSMGYLLAAAQALLMIIVIARKSRILLSEKYLMLALACLAFTLIQYVSLFNQWLSPYSPIHAFGVIAWMAISPVLFLYVRALIGADTKWTWRNLRFFPFSLYHLVQAILLLLGINFDFALLFKDWNLYSNLWILSYLLNSLYFTWHSVQHLRYAPINEKQRGHLRWLRIFFQAFGGLLIILAGVLFYLMNAAVFIHSFEYLLLVCFAAFVLVLVFKSLRFSGYAHLVANAQYGSDQKKPSELEGLWQQLERCMETQKPYLAPKLTLEQLARISDIPQNQLSQVFTRHLDSNFYQYINRYRLQAFEQRVKTPEAYQFTIMALAEAAGFASRATFYKLFKAQYGMTPAAYIRQQQAGGGPVGP